MSNLPNPLKKKMYKKWWFWLIIILLLSIGGCSGGGYYYAQKMKSQNGSLEEETTAENKDLQKTVSLEGRIQSKKTVDLYFQTSGKVSETQVKVGDFAVEDQLLAKITTDTWLPDKQREIKAPFSGEITQVNIYDDQLMTIQIKALTIESEETEIIAFASENEVLDLKKRLKCQHYF